MIFPHRNELIDARKLLRYALRDKMILVDSTDAFDFASNGHVCVRRNMLRSPIAREDAQLIARDAFAALLDADLRHAIAEYRADRWGSEVKVTGLARWNPPTYDYKKKRWDEVEDCVALVDETGNLDAVYVNQKYLELLWPWAGPHRPTQWRWDGDELGPLVLVEAVSQPYLPSCDVLAILMPVRP